MLMIETRAGSPSVLSVIHVEYCICCQYCCCHCCCCCWNYIAAICASSSCCSCLLCRPQCQYHRHILLKYRHLQWNNLLNYLCRVTKPDIIFVVSALCIIYVQSVLGSICFILSVLSFIPCLVKATTLACLRITGQQITIICLIYTHFLVKIGCNKLDTVAAEVGSADGDSDSDITMDCCGRKRMLMVLTSASSCAAFGLLCIAVATDYWLYTWEKLDDGKGVGGALPKNQTDEYKVLYSGLWRKCEEVGRGKMKTDCSYINYFTKDVDRDGLKPTDAILLNMRRSTFFPLTSLLILLIGGILCFVGHCHSKKKVLTFVAGIFFVLAGLCTLVGIILYIGSITEEVGNKPRQTDSTPSFKYIYGSSFMMAIGSFVLTELSGVLSVYLFIEKKKRSPPVVVADANDKPHPPPNANRYRRSRSQSNDRSQSRSRDASLSRSESYFTYTPMSETSREMSSYTFPRDPSRHTISTTVETHIPKDQSIHSVDTLRRTTPV